MDTTSEGNLARGKVGHRQLNEIDDELEAIDHLEDYAFDFDASSSCLSN